MSASCRARRAQEKQAAPAAEPSRTSQSDTLFVVIFVAGMLLASYLAVVRL